MRLIAGKCQLRICFCVKFYFLCYFYRLLRPFVRISVCRPFEVKVIFLYNLTKLIKIARNLSDIDPCIFSVLKQMNDVIGRASLTHFSNLCDLEKSAKILLVKNAPKSPSTTTTTSHLLDDNRELHGKIGGRCHQQEGGGGLLLEEGGEGL